MRRLALLVAVAFVATACGGSDDLTSFDVSTSNAPVSSAVLHAGQKTQAAKSARVAFTATFSGSTNGTMSGEGVFAKRKGRLTIDLSGLAGGALGKGRAEIVFDNLVYYVKLPPGTIPGLPGGKTWFKVDLEKLGETQGLSLAELAQLNQSDPSQALDLIQGASEDFREVGGEDVRGVETTHYQGTIDLQQVANEAPPELRDQYRRLFELSPDKSVSMDVWVGGDGLVRKIRFAQKLPGSSTMTMEEELYDFGTAVNANVPADNEVFDLTELIGAS